MIRGLGVGAAVALCATMIKMSIRRKLFFAFTLVAAISSAALLWVARSYIGTVRAELDRRFLEDAKDALDRQGWTGEERVQAAFDVLTDVAAEPDILKATNRSEPWFGGWSDDLPHAPLVQVALWDASKRQIVRSATRPGAQVTLLADVDPNEIAARLKEPRAARLGNVPILWADTGPLFPIAAVGDQALLGYVIGQIDTCA